MADKVQVRDGMGLLGWLTVAFVVLKLTGFIEWSWWLVLAPTLVPLGIVAAILLLVAAYAMWEGR